MGKHFGRMAPGSGPLLLLLAVLVGAVVMAGAPVVYAGAKAPIDLNTASQKDLESLKGVGPATAKKIIDGRPYKSVDELSRAGVPAKTIESLKPLVTVGSAPAAAATTPAPAKASPAPESAAKASPPQKVPPPVEKKAAPVAKLAPGERVNINTASKEQLDVLPGIGPVKAQAIIDGRPYAKPEDIMKVKGIKQGEYNKIKDLITVR